jgi:RNA ligase
MSDVRPAVPTPRVDGFDEQRFQRLVADGYIAARRDEHSPTWLFNYTPRAQFKSVWTPETLICRGVVTDDDGTVLARPFAKFFNLSELPATPVGPYDVFDKLDGSLGIVRVGHDGRLCVSTRGAFDSDQARWATEHLRARARSWRPPTAVTLCVEIIYPDNQVVVDYGQRAELVALAAIDVRTGRDVDIPHDWPGPVLQRIDEPKADLAELCARAAASDLPGTAAEGWVVRFDSGERVKVKLKAYVELHRLLTNVTTRTVWEQLNSVGNLDELLAVAPDELHSWLRDTAAEITAQLDALDGEAAMIAAAAPCDVERRELARWVLSNTDHPSLVFAHVDNKHHTERYRRALWDLVRPGPDVRP